MQTKTETSKENESKYFEIIINIFLYFYKNYFNRPI